ncbi:protein kinase [Coleofasciculus sp. H7-2]|uniref:protein kinase domain-containing protein n=1 Tax=Coleofasciculus sp. H7-2 TaxID=3351545 RepID=UPI00366B6112
MPLLRGHYRLIQLLSAQDGFGRTYLAEDIDKMNEPCIIKQLKPQVQGSQETVQLFKQEAQRLQQLGEHPQIPTLYAYFEEESYLYLVQQLIEGQNLLKELEQRGAFSENQIRELLLDILPVLKFVHEKKVIHRDINPQDIIRRRSDNKLVLSNFGASQHLATTQAIQPGTRIGSLGYTSYEEMKGGAASPSSDLFSLGATCFHLLSQKHPHLLCLDRGYEWVHNWRQHLGRSVTSNLGKVLDKLLQKDVNLRYQSADEVIRDLLPQASTVRSDIPIKQIINHLTTKLILVTFKLKQNLRYELFFIPTVFLLGLVLFKNYGYINHISASMITFSLNNLSSPGFLQKTLSGHSSKVNSVAISPDGQILASGSHDKTIKVWNLETGELNITLTGHYYSVYCVAISPDGATFASASNDTNIKIWLMPQ